MSKSVPKSISDLKQDPENARRHTERNLAMIGDSLEAVGAGRSVVIDETNTLLAGNATAKKAAEQGLKLKVVDVDGGTLVAVRRRDLSPEQKRKLALFDNRSAELAEWDPAVLRAFAADGALTGLWGDRELENLLAAFDETTPGQTDPDALPPVRPTTIRRGDLFQLGEHRLLCGSSADEADVRRLMGDERAAVFATDPPYLIDYTGTLKARGRVQARDDADSADWDSAAQGAEFFDRFIAVAQKHALESHAAWYCWHASRRQAMLEQAWERAGAFVHQQIVWVKTRATFGRSVYMWRHELCFFGWLRSKKPRVRKAPLADGQRTTVWRAREKGDVLPPELPTTVWLIPSAEIETTAHPTSKPVVIFLVPLLMHTNRGEVAYEPFSGSGSQIIAAEQTGRRCRAMELEPKYVQLAVDRWEAFTGKRARALGKGREA